jgi:Protein of unknown function (DUF1634)
MALWFKPLAAGDPNILETREQQISLILSSVAVILMLLGLSGFYLRGGLWTLPGNPAETLAIVTHSWSLDLTLMSLGILLLGVLPLMRVALALWFYGREKQFGEALVALTVLVELCLSLFWGAK